MFNEISLNIMNLDKYHKIWCYFIHLSRLIWVGTCISSIFSKSKGSICKNLRLYSRLNVSRSRLHAPKLKPKKSKSNLGQKVKVEKGVDYMLKSQNFEGQNQILKMWKVKVETGWLLLFSEKEKIEILLLI